MLRSVVASVAARLDLSYDAIDDLKIGLDEACGHLLDAAPDASSLRLRIVIGPASLEARVSVDAEAPFWPPEDFQDTLSWQILSALADEIILSEDGGPAVFLTKRIPERSGE